MDCFLVIDKPRSGVENMAFDQHLLELASSTDRAFIRIYQWAEPTLSLGYFQPWRDRESHDESQQLTMVRRSSGGGAIVHHHDWTYSVALPAPRDSRTNLGAAQPVYDAVHQAVKAWLAELEITATLADPFACQGHPCHFLCFHRRSVGDLVVDGHKVLGSAQRRHHGALLQHGSLLLAGSQFAPSLMGLNELSSAPLQLDDEQLNRFAKFISDAVGGLLETAPTKVDYSDPLFTFDYSSSPYADPKWAQKR